MKATIFASAAVLFTVALAAPTLKTRQDASTFTLQLSDDMSGLTDSRPVAIDAGPINLGEHFPSSTLAPNGTLIATSALNSSPGLPVTCTIVDPISGATFQLDQQLTYADLDGNPNQAIPTDITDFTIDCVSQ